MYRGRTHDGTREEVSRNSDRNRRTELTGKKRSLLERRPLVIVGDTTLGRRRGISSSERQTTNDKRQ